MLTLLVSIIGFFVVHRIFQQFSHQYLISSQLESLFFIMSLIVLSCLVLIFRTDPIALWIFFGIFCFSLKLFQRNFSKMLERQFEKRILGTLDVIILQIKSGNSLRQAVREVVEQSEGWFRQQMQEIHSAILLDSNTQEGAKSLPVKDFAERIKKIEQQKSNVLEALQRYRDSVKTKQDFRRRSGKIRSQTYAQSIVMILLYLLILGFSTFQFGWQSMRPILPYSVTFFVAGVVLIMKIGRRMKWKT